jgi:deoxycytidylate deaminase
MTLVPLVRRRSSELPGAAISKEIEDRRTPELVIAFVGPIGAGVSTAATSLTTLLTDEYGYEVRNYKMSELILSRMRDLGEPVGPWSKAGERIQALQKAGNRLRELFGDDHLAKLAVREIARKRVASGGYRDPELQVVEPKKVAHVIDGLKNPAEYSLLELVYGEIFWLLGVFAPESLRKRRLQDRGVVDDCDLVVKHDEDEEGSSGQKVRELFFRADYFLRNDSGTTDRIGADLDRFLRVVLNIGVNGPTADESGMFSAAAAATRSACLSRQVGAAIYSRNNELLGVGWNDVPKAGGGLYVGAPPGATATDSRCYRWDGPQGRRCYNDWEKDDGAGRATQALEKFLRPGVDRQEVTRVLRAAAFGNVVEFSRSVHAEMEAIISIARSSAGSPVEGTLYSTTFPCHNCARHIVAAGISTVFFIEPYPKSLAVKLHGDSINWETSGTAQKMVSFLQYAGFAPRNIVELFAHGVERKREGLPIVSKRQDAVPVFMPLLDAFSIYEKKVVEDLEKNPEGGGKR